MKNWRNELFAWLLMLSGLGTILLLMGSTFYVVIAQSLGWFNLEGDSHFSLEYWRNMLQDEVLQSALFYSVKVSLLGAFGSVIFAYPLALWLRKPMVGKAGIIAVLRAPMFIPGLVARFCSSISWLITASSTSCCWRWALSVSRCGCRTMISAGVSLSCKSGRTCP
ncbi:TPA: hypothetical protein L7O78_004766 [Klebsiella pneumoniae]|nr:hypothetical protein [Klebsiella pneumoniae]